MKKFVFLFIGFIQPTPEIMESWMQWFKSIEDKIEDQVGLANGKEVTKNGITELPMDLDAITGYFSTSLKNLTDSFI